MINQFQQYPNMEDVSGINGGMQDTRSQDALHQALLLRTAQANPQVQPNQQNNNMLAQMLKQGNKNKPTNPSDPFNQNTNPATGQDWSTTGSGYAGNGGYDPTAMGGMNDYLSQMGLDTGGFTGSGNFSMGGNGGFDLGGIGNMFDGWGSSIGDFLGSIGSWFGSEAAPAIGDALPAIGTAAEEAAPVAAAAA